MKITFGRFFRITPATIMRCGPTFRLARTHPTHARSSGLETSLRSRSLADYTIDTHESEFSDQGGLPPLSSILRAALEGASTKQLGGSYVLEHWIGQDWRSILCCACRKSDSAILVMKAAEDRLGCDDAEALNRPVEWGILVQRAMNARFIIIRGIPTQDDPAQVRLPKYDHVVETFPSDRADQSLDVRVLPRRSGSSRLVPNAHGTQPLPEDHAIPSVSVPNKIAR